MMTYATITTTQELLQAAKPRRQRSLQRRIMRWQAQRRRAQRQEQRQQQPDITFSLH